MRTELKQLANEAIQLELNVAQLYKLFSDAFPQDRSFWWQLAMEEGNHAALIKSGVDYFMDQGLFPQEMLIDNLDVLRAINAELTELIEQYNNKRPSRQIAFAAALKLECSAAEAHYQNMMTCKDGPKMLELFRNLNGEDKDHAERIRTYMNEKGIK